MVNEPCHMTSKRKVENICEEGIKPHSHFRKEGTFRNMAEEDLEWRRPRKYPSREKCVFLFPPRECENPPQFVFNRDIELTVNDEEVEGCSCYLGNFDMFTRLTGAVKDENESRIRNTATAYWREFEKCGTLSECVQKVEGKEFESIFGEDNREIVCECGIPPESIEECG